MLISIEIHIRTCYFPGGGVPDPLSPSGSAHGQCHHNGTISITAPLLTMIHDCRHALSGLMTDEVFQMTHFDTFEKHSSWKWWFLQFSFFRQNIHYLNAVSRTISVTG